MSTKENKKSSNKKLQPENITVKNDVEKTLEMQLKFDDETQKIHKKISKLKALRDSAEKKQKEDFEKLESKSLPHAEYDKKYNIIHDKYNGIIENTTVEISELESKINDIKEKYRQNKHHSKIEGSQTLSVRSIAKANKKPNKLPIPTHMMSDDNIIEIRNVMKFYTTGKMAFEVLKGVNLEIKKGDFVILYGKSGSGKSTLLNIMSGLDRATDGSVIALGKNISAMNDKQNTRFRRDNVGFIFQRYNLLPNLNAYENVETGAYLQKDKKKRLDIKELFSLMDITESMYKYPSEMSGGQQQRVSIARALVKNPSILFADEPTGALDDKMSLAVLKILSHINVTYGTTIVMVSHDQLVADIATKVVTLKSGHIESIKINENPKKPEDLKW